MYLEKHHIDKPRHRGLKLEGKRFERLKVIRFYDTIPIQNRTRWLCECDCGEKIIAIGSELNRGSTKSCGCLTEELRVFNNWKHGHSRKRLYKTWEHMISRCYDENNSNYTNYGGRKITVCIEWHDIDNFVEWAMESGYEEGLTIERLNNNKNYDPQNCGWATVKEQANNRRTNLIIKHKGEEKTLTQWAELYGLSVSAVFSRYYRGDRDFHLFRPIKRSE